MWLRLCHQPKDGLHNHESGQRAVMSQNGTEPGGVGTCNAIATTMTATSCGAAETETGIVDCLHGEILLSSLTAQARALVQGSS